MEKGRGTEPTHVLLIYRRMIPSIRLGGHSQMEAMAAEGRILYRAAQDARITKDDLAWAETVILGRLDSWYELRLARMLRAAGKKLVYMMDDDLLNIPPEVTSAGYYNQESIQRCIREIIGLSGAVMSPSPLLLEKYARDGRQGILFEEPAVAPAPYRPHSEGDPVRIGFAGSVDRMGDIETILREALLRVREEYGEKVSFTFFGGKPAFADELGAECIPYTESYDRYRETLNALAWDIGLAPMPKTPFHACKHYNKFVEYAAAGIAGIYSDVPPYDRLRAFPGCAALCPNEAGAWTAALRTLLDDRGAREEMRRKAAECAGKELDVRTCGARMLEGIGALGRGGRGGRFGPLAAYKAVNVFKRTATSLKGHGPAGFVKHAYSVFIRGKD